MPSVSSSSSPKVLLSSTVMTPSLPTLSIASAMISPIWVSAAEIEAVEATCSLVSTSLASLDSSSLTPSTAASMPRLSNLGFAPAATLRRPSRTSACASTVAVVVPSPATSSVFFATSLTSSAPIFSNGSSSSISLAMLTPSLVIVGAPHFFSSTTLRPLGPRVTFTASARVFIPRSRPRRASSSNEISLGILRESSRVEWFTDGPMPATDDRGPGGHVPPGSGASSRPSPVTPSSRECYTSPPMSANQVLALDPSECKPAPAHRSRGMWLPRVTDKVLRVAFVTAQDLIRSADDVLGLLGSAQGKDWSAPATGLTWTCRETVEHMADSAFTIAGQLGPRAPGGGGARVGGARGAGHG